jgi:hypothetical protein
MNIMTLFEQEAQSKRIVESLKKEFKQSYDSGHAQGSKEERVAILQTIEALYGSEEDHPMFAEGYNSALDHIREFIEGRKK